MLYKNSDRTQKYHQSTHYHILYYTQISSGSALIDHNNITYTKRGILQNLAYGTASLFEIKNNTLTADATPEVANVGLLYWSIASGITATATNNTINAGENGARIWNCQGNVSINGGTINGGQIGVYATTTDAYGDGSNQNASINNVNIIGSIATGDIGVKVYSHLSGKTSSLTVTNNCNISGYDKGIYTKNIISNDFCSMLKQWKCNGCLYRKSFYPMDTKCR